MESNIKEGNKLIALFMGGKLSKSGRTIKIKNTVFEPCTLSYHKSWNNLMPVFLKVNETVSDNGGCYITIHSKGVSSCDEDFIFAKDNPIKSLWLPIVDFIKFYNQKQINQ